MASFCLEEHQTFLKMVKSHWRGWHIILFEDRASQHTAKESVALAAELGTQVRFLPRATPELNAMDNLWRRTKGEGLANWEMVSVTEAADCACQYILRLSPGERLRKAGVLSGNFWLAE